MRRALDALPRVLVVLAVLASADAARAQMVSVVTADRVNVRSEPNTIGRVVQTLNKGDVVQVLDRSGDWYLVKTATGDAGFVHQTVISPPEKTAATSKPPAAGPQPLTLPPQRTTPPPDRTSPPPTAPAAPAQAAPPPPAQAMTPPAVPPTPAAQAVQPPGSLPPPPGGASRVVFLARFGGFIASDSAFKDIYGTGYVFGGEMRVALPWPDDRRLLGWLEGAYRERTGQFSYTHERTKVNVRSVEGGILYRITRGGVSPYVGGGVGYYMFEERNEPLGKAAQNKIGYCGVAGLSVAVIKRVELDVRVKYSTSTIQPAEFRVNVGGLTIGAGAGVRF